MNTARSIVAGAALLTLPAEAQDHRFETDPVATVREDFVACDVLSELQRVMDNPRFLQTLHKLDAKAFRRSGKPSRFGSASTRSGG